DGNACKHEPYVHLDDGVICSSFDRLLRNIRRSHRLFATCQGYIEFLQHLCTNHEFRELGLALQDFIGARSLLWLTEVEQVSEHIGVDENSIAHEVRLGWDADASSLTGTPDRTEPPSVELRLAVVNSLRRSPRGARQAQHLRWCPAAKHEYLLFSALPHRL